MPDHMSRGLYIALLGIDGVGKTTLAREIGELAQSCGRTVHFVSWRQYLENAIQNPDWSLRHLNILQNLWVDSFRVYFSGSCVKGSPTDLPASYEDLVLRGTEYLNGYPTDHLRESGPIAASWVELAANTLIYMGIISPLLTTGDLVIQESFGYKHLIKLIATFDFLSEGRYCQETAIARKFVSTYFGHFLRPDIGIYIDADPRVALKWRMSQASRVGTFEAYSTAETDLPQSFLAMQSTLRRDLQWFAGNFHWLSLRVDDVPRKQNRDRTFDALSSNELIASWLGLRSSRIRRG